MTEAMFSKLSSAIDSLNMIAAAAGVADDEWDEDACKGILKELTRRAVTPHCSSTCQALGSCDDDCHAALEACGPLGTYNIQQLVLPGGPGYPVLVGMVGSEVLPCFLELSHYATGNGDDSKICDSSSSTFSHMAFGSSPGVDCLPLSTDPNSFLRDPSTSSIGDCALAQWDDFEVETSAVNAHNEELLAAAKNATNSTSGAEDLSVEAPADSYPAWRLPAIFGLLLIKIAAVLFGDALTKKKTGGGDMAAVAPVRALGRHARARKRGRCWVPSAHPPPPPNPSTPPPPPPTGRRRHLFSPGHQPRPL
jgi:hypothetical protein